MTILAPVWSRSLGSLRLMLIANGVILALAAALIAWMVVAGELLEPSSRALEVGLLASQLSIVSVILSLAVMMASQYMVVELSHWGVAGRQGGRADWWDRVHWAVRLTSTGNGPRAAGLTILERLAEDPEATAQDREMVRGLIGTLDLDSAEAIDNRDIGLRA